MKDKDTSLGLVLILLSGFGLYYSYQIPTSLNSSSRMPPNAFPIFLFYALAVCGVVLFVQGLRCGEKAAMPYFNWKKIVPVAVLVLVYAFLVGKVGFMISTFVFMLLTMLVLGERKWYYLLIVPTLFSAGLYYMFIEVFKVNLP